MRSGHQRTVLEWLEYGYTRIFEVELSGLIDYSIHNSLVCTSDMTVLRELTIGEAAELCGGYILMIRNGKLILLDRDEAVSEDKDNIIGAFMTLHGFTVFDDGTNITCMDRNGNVVYQSRSEKIDEL